MLVLEVGLHPYKLAAEIYTLTIFGYASRYAVLSFTIGTVHLRLETINCDYPLQNSVSSTGTSALLKISILKSEIDYALLKGATH